MKIASSKCVKGRHSDSNHFKSEVSLTNLRKTTFSDAVSNKVPRKPDIQQKKDLENPMPFQRY